MVFSWSPHASILLYTSKNIKNSYILYSCFEILYSSKNIMNSYNFYTYVLKYYLEFIVAVLYLLDKLETKNEKWEMITCQYNLLFLNFLFVNDFIV